MTIVLIPNFDMHLFFLKVNNHIELTENQSVFIRLVNSVLSIVNAKRSKLASMLEYQQSWTKYNVHSEQRSQGLHSSIARPRLTAFDISETYVNSCENLNMTKS